MFPGPVFSARKAISLMVMFSFIIGIAMSVLSMQTHGNGHSMGMVSAPVIHLHDDGAPSEDSRHFHIVKGCEVPCQWPPVQTTEIEHKITYTYVDWAVTQLGAHSRAFSPPFRPPQGRA